MKRVLTAAIALSLLGGSAARAQPYHSDHDRPEIQQDCCELQWVRQELRQDRREMRQDRR